jgi:hypothetical protein
MALGRVMPPLTLSDDVLLQLQGIASSRSLPDSNVQRTSIIGPAVPVTPTLQSPIGWS